MSEHTQQSRPEPGAFSEPSGRGRRRVASAVLIALVWVLVVTVTAGVGWLVVDRAGGSLLEASGIGFAATPGSGAPTDATVTNLGTSSAALSTAGGRVVAMCAAKGIALQYATPAQGWRMQVEDTRADRLRVEFEKGGESSKTVEVEGRCAGGTPELTQSRHSGGQDSGGQDSGGQDSGSQDSGTTSPGAPTTSEDHGGGSDGGGSGGGSGSGSGGSPGGGSDDHSGSSGGGSGGGADDHGGSGK